MTFPNSNTIPSTKLSSPEETEQLLLDDNGARRPHHEHLSLVDLSLYSWEEKLSWLNGIDLWSLKEILSPLPPVTGASSATPATTGTTTTATPREDRSILLQSIRLSDGPHGVRKPLSSLSLQTSYPATCFPSACAAACSWNVNLIQQMGVALSKECDYYDIQCLLGPGVNIKRYPTGGRNHEYYSEDPYLTGKLARAYITGLQESGTVAACIKHYCVNNQESHRMVVNVFIDERTLRELYLPAFEMTIVESDLLMKHQTVSRSSNQQQQPKLIMSAYNRVMGDYAGESSNLLQTILRNEWNFTGLVVSDWGAVNDRVQAIQSGLDLEMPGNCGAWHPEVAAAIRENRLSIQDIDNCARRVVRFIQDHQKQPNTITPAVENNGHSHDDDVEMAVHTDGTTSSIDHPFPPSPIFQQNDQLARQLASECIVLLHNVDNFLPLTLPRGRKIGLIGDFSKTFPRYQGMGSAHVTPTKVLSVYDTIQSLVQEGGDGAIVEFSQGYDANSDDGDLHETFIADAVQVAKNRVHDPVIVFVGLPEIMESEGFDRDHLRLPQQHIALVDAVCKVNTNVVIVLVNGGVVEIPDTFVQNSKAIIEGFLLGQAGGGAIVDVLYGVVSPSGKLPETIPLGSNDIPAHAHFPGSLDAVEYREGLNVGYRYFNTANVPVRFPFGHGLHYSPIEYTNLDVVIECDTIQYKIVRLSCDIQNAGTQYSVKEVVQLYVRPIDSAVYRPIHELKDFDKIEVAPGETKRVSFVLNERAFAFFDIGVNEWIVDTGGGGFEIQVGASSRDIRLSQTITFQEGKEASQAAKESYPPVPMTRRNSVSQETDDAVFAKRFGPQEQDVMGYIRIERSLVRNGRKKTVHRNTLLKNAAAVSWLATLLFYITLCVPSSQVKAGPFKAREMRMIRANVENLPLRGLVLFGGGNITFRLLDFLIFIMNGQYWTAIQHLFSKGPVTVRD
jgi:beta-glucosidase